MTRQIIIYGGSGGIGGALARRLSARGDRVHLVARDRERLTSLAEEMDAGFTVGDVTDPDLFTRVADEAGDFCDGLVYAVGTINLRSLQRLTEDDFLTEFRVNALGAALRSTANRRLRRACLSANSGDTETRWAVGSSKRCSR